MSLVVAWIAVHAQGASLYFASDSRISWGSKNHWDHAQKVFASPTTNELLGYAGDVLFPTQTLSQICQIAQNGVLFSIEESPDKRVDRYCEIMRSALESYPKDQLAEPFDILYACHYEKSFWLFRISSTTKHDLFKTSVNIERKSAPIEVLGSGAEDFWSEYKKQAATSYGIFHALANVIDLELDPKVGGIPQVVSLYSDGRTNTYGLSYFGQPALLGFDLNAPGCPSTIEWRNENFERWNFAAKTLQEGAQRQPRLKKNDDRFLP
jgi:hypothetical protein